MPMTMEEAVLHMRRDSRFSDLLRDAYLDADNRVAAERFSQSGEFDQVLHLIGERHTGTVLDLGAGTGLATFAFIGHGARLVYVLEPDASQVVGRGAIAALVTGQPVELLDASGESIPLPDRSVDVVYARQVLHHTRDLNQVLGECARVLVPGGVFLACREHVVDDEAQLRVFLQRHPMHQFTHGENAYSLPAYLDAIRHAGLNLQKAFGPWESIINAFPGVTAEPDLSHYPEYLVSQCLGKGVGMGGALTYRATSGLAMAQPDCAGAALHFPCRQTTNSIKVRWDS